jgi:SSS family solute:Na+ symporter
MIWGLSFAVFCLFTVWLGYRASHGIHDIKRFLVGDQNFGNFALFSTIVASFVGGGVVMGTAEKAFQFGIGHALGLLGFGLQLFLTGWWVAPRIARFRNALSIGEVIGTYYGKLPRMLTGLLWLSFCIGILTAQMSAMGNLITSLLGYERSFSIFISAGIVIFYCYIGGIRAVVATDILQFVLLSIAIVLVTIFGISHLGGWDSFIAKVPEAYLSPTSYLSSWELVLLFLSFLLGDALIPPVFQRLVMAKDVKIAKRSYIWSGLIFIPLCLFVFSHGLIAYVSDPTIPKEQITAYLFNETLPMPIAIIALLGFLAVIMSSADSYLNAAAGSLVTDLVIPVAGKSLSRKAVLNLAKWTTIIIGALSITFAIAVQDILDILLKTYQFWGPTLVIPILGIISDKQVPPWGFYASVITGGLTVVVWNTFQLEEVTHLSALIAGLLSNAVVYTTSYWYAKSFRLKQSFS